MKSYIAALLLACSVAGPAGAEPESVIVSDSLAAHAERPKVKRGNSWFGKIAKWSIGNYVVVSSKDGMASMTSKEGDDKTESRTTHRFSFELTDKGLDTARVSALQNIATDSLHEGGNVVVQSCDSFTAIITVNQDTTDTWTLFILITKNDYREGHLTASLSSGERTILLSAVNSIADGDYGTPWTARGFEFFENDQSLGAVQFRGGVFGTVFAAWMRTGLDARVRLVLAAAMTTVLEQYSLQDQMSPLIDLTRE